MVSLQAVVTGAWLPWHCPELSQVSGSVHTVSAASPQRVPEVLLRHISGVP